MSTELSIFRDHIPSLPRRGVAKAIDFVAVAFTVVGFSRITGSYLAGLLIGYGWLALSDWFGSFGKWIMKLEVRDHGTGGGCSAWASIVRNLPIIATVLPLKIHQALLGMDRLQYRETHPDVIVSMSCVALIVLAVMFLVAYRNPERRHIGDYLARTVVVHRKKESSSTNQGSLHYSLIENARSMARSSNPGGRIIRTPKGEIKLLEPTVALLRSVRASLPFGVVWISPPQRGADFGIVMQCGEQEAVAVKQQCVDLDQKTGDLYCRGNHLLIAGALSRYRGNGFGGLLMPVAYHRSKEDGRVEAGFAYFGSSSPAGREAMESHERSSYDDQFGCGFEVMIRRFIEALAHSSLATGIPLQSPIIGLDIRKRLQLETILFGFLVQGPHLICLRTSIDEQDPTWAILRDTGVSALFHLPSVPLAIGADELKTAKPESNDVT